MGWKDCAVPKEGKYPHTWFGCGHWQLARPGTMGSSRQRSSSPRAKPAPNQAVSHREIRVPNPCQLLPSRSACCVCVLTLPHHLVVYMWVCVWEGAGRAPVFLFSRSLDQKEPYLDPTERMEHLLDPWSLRWMGYRLPPVGERVGKCVLKSVIKVTHGIWWPEGKTRAMMFAQFVCFSSWAHENPSFPDSSPFRSCSHWAVVHGMWAKVPCGISRLDHKTFLCILSLLFPLSGWGCCQSNVWQSHVPYDKGELSHGPEHEPRTVSNARNPTFDS